MSESISPSVQAGVIEVLKNVSRRPIEPSPGSDLVADLGFDSLQVLETVSELEDRFDIAIPMDEVPAIRTVAQVVERVAALVEARPHA
jgi:acyl carrier protein